MWCISLFSVVFAGLLPPTLILIIVTTFVLLSVPVSVSVGSAKVTFNLKKTQTCYPRVSPCQDPAGNRTTRRPPDHCKETQTAVVWSCHLFIRSGQNHLARHSETRKKTRHTEEEVARQHQGMDRPGVRQVPEGSKKQGKMEETGCEIVCGAPTTLAVKG